MAWVFVGARVQGKGKSFHYFMFTDVLLKTRFERKSKNYTLVDTIWFAEVVLRDVNLSAKGAHVFTPFRPPV